MNQTRALWLYSVFCLCCGVLPYGLFGTATIGLFDRYDSDLDQWKWQLAIVFCELLAFLPLLWYKNFWHRYGPIAVIIGQLAVVMGFYVYRHPLALSMRAETVWTIHNLTQIYMGTLDKFEEPTITLVLLIFMFFLHIKLRHAFDPDQELPKQRHYASV
jgi:hypothetical protein